MCIRDRTRDVRASFIGPIRIGLLLWNSVILQKVMHNCCTWIKMAQRTTRKLERIQLQFLKKLYSLPPTAPNAGTWWISGCLPLSWKVLAAKFKFVFHLTKRGPMSVAGKVWELEKSGHLPGGLFSELAEANRVHGIPLPDNNLDKKEYATQVNKSVFRAAARSVGEAVRASPKLQLLWQSEHYGAELNDWHNNADIQLAARAKLSCVPEFGGDWGRGELCECGERDTFRHAALPNDQVNCHKYDAARLSHPRREHDDYDLLKFTKEVLRIKENTAAIIQGRLAGG